MNNLNRLEYKGYVTEIQFNNEDKVLYGKILNIEDLVGFKSKSIAEIESEFHKAVDDYLTFCKNVGKSPQLIDKSNSSLFGTNDMEVWFALEVLKTDVKWLKYQLKEDVGILHMKSLLEQKFQAEELAVIALEEKLDRDKAAPLKSTVVWTGNGDDVIISCGNCEAKLKGGEKYCPTCGCKIAPHKMSEDFEKLLDSL